jgi:hypothetical protein
MCKAGENDMFELTRLRGDGLGNDWMRMAMQIHPPRRNRVHQTPAVRRIEVCAFATSDFKRRQFVRFLRVRMPNLHSNARESKCCRNVAMSVWRLIVSSHGIQPTIGTFP